MTSGQETERVHSYNPGARTGPSFTWKMAAKTEIENNSVQLRYVQKQQAC